jgi:multiple sugar transport system substrate-binding protein
VLTHNATISIAAKWLDDMNNATLTDAQRAEAKKNYTELIATAAFPNKPDGSKMVYRTAVKTGVIFKRRRTSSAPRSSWPSCCRTRTSRPTSRVRWAAGSR